MSIRSALLLSLTTTTMSGHLCSITWSLWIFISQRIFTLCLYDWFSRMLVPQFKALYVICFTETPVDSSSDFGVSSCTPVVLIYYIRLSCVWLSVLCSCTSCTLLDLPGFLFLTLITLVRSAWSWAAMRNPSVCFFSHMLLAKPSWAGSEAGLSSSSGITSSSSKRRCPVVGPPYVVADHGHHSTRSSRVWSSSARSPGEMWIQWVGEAPVDAYPTIPKVSRAADVRHSCPQLGSRPHWWSAVPHWSTPWPRQQTDYGTTKRMDRNILIYSMKGRHTKQSFIVIPHTQQFTVPLTWSVEHEGHVDPMVDAAEYSEDKIYIQEANAP